MSDDLARLLRMAAEEGGFRLDDDAEERAAAAAVSSGILAAIGYTGRWKVSRGLNLPLRPESLSPEAEEAFQAEFKRLSDQFSNDLEAAAKRILGDAVLIASEAETIVQAALAAGKAAAPKVDEADDKPDESGLSDPDINGGYA